MRRLALTVVVLLLAAASTALASDPKKRINPADQARARAMLVRQSDVGLGYRAVRSGDDPSNVNLNCPALDESDLTVTGRANSPNFTSGLQTVASAAGIYASVHDANASWRRGTSAAGFTCLTNVFRKLSRAGGLRFVSFRAVPFPSVAPRVAAFRWQVLASSVRIYTDVVFLMRGRAQAAAFFIAGIDPLERDEQLRLTRAISRRMAKAMRGA
jgi:hypothetical protein